jgi:hypothetical protein
MAAAPAWALPALVRDLPVLVRDLPVLVRDLPVLVRDLPAPRATDVAYRSRSFYGDAARRAIPAVLSARNPAEFPANRR